MLSSLRRMFAAPRPAAYHRRWPRIVMSEPARVSLRDAAAQQALLEQVCAGGARVKLAQRVAPGTTIGIRFKPSAGEQTYDFAAVVVHANREERGFSWHCGLSFVDADPRETQRLSAFVDAERNRRTTGVMIAPV